MAKAVQHLQRFAKISPCLVQWLVGKSGTSSTDAAGQESQTQIAKRIKELNNRDTAIQKEMKQRTASRDKVGSCGQWELEPFYPPETQTPGSISRVEEA